MKFRRCSSRIWVGSTSSNTGGISLDLADPKSKRAIEVDGPSHYLQEVSSGDYVVNGPTQFKARLLRGLGWTVAHVAFHEWGDRSEHERRELLQAKVAA
mmetsp:Transcript_18907/g.61016  ORF Transcript_18907/g.61016 Transcript_18907/m.61016 type:complete len:99 (-) Transcript_18907:241-537(-)